MITVDDVVKEVRSIAIERPDFIYLEQPLENEEDRSTNCSYLSAGLYTNEGEGCIVGQALSKLGITDEELRRVENASAADALRAVGVEGSTRRDRELNWLNSVQSQQDIGMTWGDAIAWADQR